MFLVRSCVRALAPFAACGLFAAGAAAADVKTIFDPPGEAEDWYVTIGASGALEPAYPGSDDYKIRPSLLFSVSKASDLNTFRSVSDNPSIAFFDTGTFSLGPAFSLDWGRKQDDADHLRGTGDLSATVGVGGFAEWYPVEWLRLRGEVLYGFGGYEGWVGDVGADFIFPLADQWRFAIGPRLSFSGTGYMNAYFGVSPIQALTAQLLLNPLPVYNASSGFDEVGVTAQVSKEFGHGFTAGLYGSYGQLLGSAASSPLTQDINQFEVGVSLSYTFNMGKGWW